MVILIDSIIQWQNYFYYCNLTGSDERVRDTNMMMSKLALSVLGMLLFSGATNGKMYQMNFIQGHKNNFTCIGFELQFYEFFLLSFKYSP